MVHKFVRKSICFLTHDLMMGGIENVLIEAVNTLHTNYHIRIVCLYGEFQQVVIDRFPEDVEVEFKNMPRTKWLRLPFVTRNYFKKVLGNQHYDYIIALKGFERHAYCCKGDCRFIYWCFNDFHSLYTAEKLTKQQKQILSQDRKLYKHIDAVWTVTSGIAEESNALYKTSIFQPLPLSIDCSAISQKAMMPCDTEFDKSKTNLILLGRVSSEKGFSRILKKMPSLSRDFPSVHLHMIGGGNNLPQLQRKCTEMGLDHCITFWGAQANPFPFLKQGQLFICPSHYESFGLVMMEAMFLGIPLITTATTGGKYVTQNGTLAKCVDNTDEALYDAVRSFLQNPAGYNYSLERAKQWAHSHDRIHFAKRLLNLLETVDS
ncbi:MAG: glycosyltransferase [Clostridia bacterium]|nr:glycosyltransferase [Clostridia bacterium]